MPRVIHFIYPFDAARFAAPWSIGNEVTAGLRAHGYVVQQYDWQDRSTIVPSPGDVLLGHPHPDEGYIYQNSLGGSWAKKIAMCPISETVADLIDRSDHYLAIAGPLWRDLPAKLGLDHMTTRMDMAIDPNAISVRKEQFAAPGQRRFLHIGCTLPCKDIDKLTALAKRTGWEFAHLGFGSIEGVACYEYAPIEDRRVQQFIASFDVLIMTSSFDANPTTVLEAGMIGLATLCSAHCGWDSDITGVYGVTVNDAERRCRKLQEMPEEQLLATAAVARYRIATRYTWKRFVEKVIACLPS